MPVSNFSIAVLMGHDTQDQECSSSIEKESTATAESQPHESEDKTESTKEGKTNLRTIQSVTIVDECSTKGNSDKNATNVTTMSTFQRKRTSFSRLQQRMLEAKFQRAPYLTIQERNNLANFLQLNSRQVKVWFQNRRNKWKRENKGQFLIQPALEMKPCNSFGTGLENCFPYVAVYNPTCSTQLYFAPGERR